MIFGVDTLEFIYLCYLLAVRPWKTSLTHKGSVSSSINQGPLQKQPRILYLPISWDHLEALIIFAKELHKMLNSVK